MGTYLHIVPADVVAMCLEAHIIVPTFYYIRPGLRNNRDWNLLLHNITQNMNPYSLTPNTCFYVLSTSIDKGFHYSQLCIIHAPQCSPARALDEFFHEIFSQNTNMATAVPRQLCPQQSWHIGGTYHRLGIALVRVYLVSQCMHVRKKKFRKLYNSSINESVDFLYKDGADMPTVHTSMQASVCVVKTTSKLLGMMKSQCFLRHGV